MREPTRRRLRQAAGWQMQRPAPEDVRALAEFVLEVTIGRDRILAGLARELARQSRYACAPAALGGAIREHNRGMVTGRRDPPPLRGKAMAFHRCYAERAAWEWLVCR